MHIRNIKDVDYKGNFKDIAHIFKKLTSSPHQNLTQAAFECGLRRNSLVEKNKFDLIPFKCKNKDVVSYLPPFSEVAVKTFEKIPFKQALNKEKIKPIVRFQHCILIISEGPQAYAPYASKLPESNVCSMEHLLQGKEAKVGTVLWQMSLRK
jgi:hypothetical protein